MVAFGKNGIRRQSHSSAGTDHAAYAVPIKLKFKRIGLACFFCGMAACILVSLIGVILLFLGFQLSAIFGRDAEQLFADQGVLQGVGFATIMAAMNWYFAYFTVPAACIALALSGGRFPRRGIVRAAPYYRWAAVWGAILVGTTTGIASFFLSSQSFVPAVSGWVWGTLIGGAAGLVCGALFRAIVRPAEQVRPIQIDVF